MIYLDYDYKIECENKIKYDTESVSSVTEFNTYFSDSNVRDGDYIYKYNGDDTEAIVFMIQLVNAADENRKLGVIFSKSNCIVKEIAQNVYKILVNVPN